jgi:hypothetical protein
MYHAEIATWWAAANTVRDAIAALQAADPPMREAIQLDTPGQGIYGLGNDFQAKLSEIASTLAYAVVWLENTGYTLEP